MSNQQFVRKYEQTPVCRLSNEYETIIDYCLKKRRCEKARGVFDFEHWFLYKVKEMNPSDTFQPEEKINNLMLLHGTNEMLATEILKGGFENVHFENVHFETLENVRHGKLSTGIGVHMTECTDIAAHLALRLVRNEDRNPAHCIFINEVMGSKRLRPATFNSSKDLGMIKHAKNSFIKHMHESSTEASSLEAFNYLNNENYRSDGQGRYYKRKKIDTCSLADVYVADASLVKPRYLLMLKAKVDDQKYGCFSEFLANQFS